jgi:hypothetical protein
VVIAVALVMMAWLPQMSTVNQVEYGRQLFQAQARFGNATRLLQSLGLFNISSTVGFRVLLALLGGLLLLRLVESADRLWNHREPITPTSEWRELGGLTLEEATRNIRQMRYRVVEASPLVQADRWPWAELCIVTAHTGAILLLVGMFLNAVWGWRLDGVVVQTGRRLALPETDHWVALSDTDDRVTHSRGIRTAVSERGPGVRVTAVDSSGQKLPLLQTPDSAGAEELRLVLTEDPYLATRETQFAIPQANLVLRVMPQPDTDPGTRTPILIQAYRSPSGDLAAQALVVDRSEFTLDGTTIRVSQAPYNRLSIVFHPGLGPALVGLALLVAGSSASIVWPVRRLWMRNGGERPTMGTGALPLVLTTRKED